MGGEISSITPAESAQKSKTSKISINAASSNNSGSSTSHNTPNGSKSTATGRESPSQKLKPTRKRSKIVLVAKNSHQSTEKKVLELIQKNNSDKKDYDMIYNIIDKHFFMQSLNKQARDEIITTMSLCKIKGGKFITSFYFF